MDRFSLLSTKKLLILTRQAEAETLTGSILISIIKNKSFLFIRLTFKRASQLFRKNSCFHLGLHWNKVENIHLWYLMLQFKFCPELYNPEPHSIFIFWFGVLFLGVLLFFKQPKTGRTFNSSLVLTGIRWAHGVTTEEKNKNGLILIPIFQEALLFSGKSAFSVRTQRQQQWKSVT